MTSFWIDAVETSAFIALGTQILLWSLVGNIWLLIVTLRALSNFSAMKLIISAHPMKIGQMISAHTRSRRARVEREFSNAGERIGRRIGSYIGLIVTLCMKLILVL